MKTQRDANRDCVHSFKHAVVLADVLNIGEDSDCVQKTDTIGSVSQKISVTAFVVIKQHSPKQSQDTSEEAVTLSQDKSRTS